MNIDAARKMPPYDKIWSEFRGRAAELAVLQHKYREVAEHGGPQAVVLLGEPGIGKTRLIQEFYGWIVEHNAGAEPIYWPRALALTADNLVLNPDPADCSIGKPIPFLWWGIRAGDRSRRNGLLGDGLWDALPWLRAHVLADVERDRRKRRFIRDMVIDVATEVGNALTYNVVGLGRTVINRAVDGYHLYKNGKSVGTSLEAENPLLTAHRTLAGQVAADIVTFAALGGAPRPGRPVVVVVDDAQYVREGEATAALVDLLARQASQRGIPVLFLLTSWEDAWDALESERLPLRNAISVSLADMMSELRIGPVDELHPILREAFPQLTQDQAALLLNKAAGNPMLLRELIHVVSTRRGLFENRDTTAPLTPEGETALSKIRVTLHDLAKERILALESSVKNAICVASLQGTRLLTLLLDDGVRRDDLAEASKGILVALGSGALEFSRPMFADVARDHAEHIVDVDKSLARLALRIRKVGGNEALFDVLDKELRPLAWSIASDTLIESSNARDREYAALCVARRAAASIEQCDFAHAHDLAALLSTLISDDRVTASGISASLLATVIKGLGADVWPIEMAPPLIDLLLATTHDTDQLLHGVAAIWTGDHAADSEQAFSDYNYALATLQAIGEFETAVARRREISVVKLRMAQLLAPHNRSAAAAMFEEALTSVAPSERALFQRAYGDALLSWERDAEALQHFELAYEAIPSIDSGELTPAVQRSVTSIEILVEVRRSLGHAAPLDLSPIAPLVLGFTGVLASQRPPPLSDEQARELLALLPVRKRLSEKGVEALAVTVWPLRFLPSLVLARFEARTSGLYAFALVGRDTLVELDGTSSMIHQTNECIGLRLDDNQALEYGAFFCEMVTSIEGSFLWLWDVDALPWRGSTLSGVNLHPSQRNAMHGCKSIEEFSDKLVGELELPRVVSMDEQGFVVAVPIVYERALIAVRWRVHRNGQMELLNDKPFAAKLPIEPDRVRQRARTTVARLFTRIGSPGHQLPGPDTCCDTLQ